jgi:hypothetical protein
MGYFFKWCAEPFAQAEVYDLVIAGLLIVLALIVAAIVLPRAQAIFVIFDLMDGGLR